MYRIAAALVSAILLTGGCAPSAGNAGAPMRADTQGADQERDANRITAEEIEAAGLPNAYELVNRLRRPWLRRDPLTGGEVAVFVENQRLGGAERLREIPAVNVAEMRFLPNEAASMRWGSAIEGSAIIVVLRR